MSHGEDQAWGLYNFKTRSFGRSQMETAVAPVEENMDINDVIDQCLDDSREWFPDTEGDIPFLLLALLGEAGESANLVKKVMRGSKTWAEIDKELVEELTDIFIYLMNLFGELSIDPIKEYQKKRAFNVDRFGQHE